MNDLVTQNPEKAEEVLDEYESQMEDYTSVYMDDPNLFEDWVVTITLNREVLRKAADEAPDSIKLRIRTLIEKE